MWRPTSPQIQMMLLWQPQNRPAAAPRLQERAPTCRLTAACFVSGPLWCRKEDQIAGEPLSVCGPPCRRHPATVPPQPVFLCGCGLVDIKLLFACHPHICSPRRPHDALLSGHSAHRPAAGLVRPGRVCPPGIRLRRGIADRLSANPSQFLRERLIESPRLRHRPPRDPFTTSGGYCTWRVRQVK